jgi:hypothetical protein
LAEEGWGDIGPDREIGFCAGMEIRTFQGQARDIQGAVPDSNPSISSSFEGSNSGNSNDEKLHILNICPTSPVPLSLRTLLPIIPPAKINTVGYGFA